MTLPNERIMAVNNTRQFLESLLDRSKPIKTTEIRHTAYRLLRHFPSVYDMDYPERSFKRDWQNGRTNDTSMLS